MNRRMTIYLHSFMAFILLTTSLLIFLSGQNLSQPHPLIAQAEGREIVLGTELSDEDMKKVRGIHKDAVSGRQMSVADIESKEILYLCVKDVDGVQVMEARRGVNDPVEGTTVQLPLFDITDRLSVPEGEHIVKACVDAFS